MSLHMEGNIGNEEEVKLFNRLKLFREGSARTLYLCVSPKAPCIVPCYNGCKINAYCIKEQFQEHCVYVLWASFIQNSV